MTKGKKAEKEYDEQLRRLFGNKSLMAGINKYFPAPNVCLKKEIE